MTDFFQQQNLADFISDYSPPPKPIDQYVVLTFKVQYHTNFGEALYISGSTDWLGKWDTSKATRMQIYKIDNRWVWQANFTMAIENVSDFQYKYFVGSYQSAEVVRWEKSNNKIVDRIDLQSHMIIDDNWDWQSHGSSKQRQMDDICPICMDYLTKDNIFFNLICSHPICLDCKTNFSNLQPSQRICSICRIPVTFAVVTRC